jgi:hypothetical protein
MSFLTLRKICFRIGRRFCMLEYVKNVNVRYVVIITFQEEHAYFTNQHKERTWQVVIGSTTDPTNININLIGLYLLVFILDNINAWGKV